MSEYGQIRFAIQKKLDMYSEDGGKLPKFAIVPFGEMEMMTKRILNDNFGIQEIGIFDNQLCKYNPAVKPVSALEEKKTYVYCAHQIIRIF